MPTNLTEKEASHFYRLFNSLLFYANNKHKIFESLKAPGDLLKSDPHDLQDLKDKLYASCPFTLRRWAGFMPGIIENG